ncbi:MAG: stage III sporulation protein AC [Oscillospiraceae bacterium]|nr:stage III sporulation protein AC [Oscillospiraceae bacterium]
MDLTIVLKIAMVGILVAILHQVLAKIGRDEYGMLVVLAGVVVILMMLIPQLLNLLDTVKAMIPM